MMKFIHASPFGIGDFCLTLAQGFTLVTDRLTIKKFSQKILAEQYLMRDPI